MGENIPGVNNVPPRYPVKPAQPSSRDRPAGKRKTERPPPDADDETGRDDDDDDKHLIDEYV